MIPEGVVTTAKLISAFTVSSGVSTMVGFAAKSSVPKIVPWTVRFIPLGPEAFRLFQKVAIPAGAAALAGMAAEQAVKYSEKEIDETVASIEKYQKKVQEAVAKAKEKQAKK